MPSSSFAGRGEKSLATCLRDSFLLVLLAAWTPFSAGARAPIAAEIAARRAAFQAPQPAPPLPPPTGNVIHVSTEPQLQAAIAALTSNETIVIAPGTYALAQTLRIRGGVSHVTIRGATDGRNDVMLLGTGMKTSGVDIGITGEDATDILIADLSIGQVFYHPIQLKGELGCERVHLYNLRLFDAGEQFVKGTVDFANPNGVDDGVVEYCVIEYTALGPDDGYTNGVDIHDGARWTIRDNLFRNIRCPATAPLAGPAVLMWSGSSDTICESNTFIDCERAVAFGLGPQTGFAHSHQRGIIRNNFISRGAGIRGDSAISVWDSPGTEVLHNSIVQNWTYPTSIEYRFLGTVKVSIANNLCDGAIQQRDGASATLAGNVTTASPALFADSSIGDLHLLSTATAAIDQAVALSDCPVDWDGDTRPYGVASDVGADEFVPPASGPPLAFYALPPCRVLDTRGPAGPLGGPALTAGADRVFLLAGRCGIPSSARAAILNVTVTLPAAAGDLRIFPAGASAPIASAINYRASQTRANNALIGLGPAGSVTVRCDQLFGTVQLIMDVSGYFQ